ncbi:unnamed protein product [Cuscuta epithymum]|uniref:Uncharacterized protein n=1 Tax=Cuscuta epithymum TaxID=186058 RepID=A0AAV0DNN5_9ASTE|nr:unnamed protein product [Cuscuta epithymum]
MVKKVVLLVAFFLHLCSKLFVRTGAAGSPVKFLPGFDGPLPFELESGYLGVGDSKDVQLFYYFIKSESNPKTDPLLLWLTGGPGCSALSGLLFEIGPITLARENYDGNLPTLLLQPNSWTKVANIIFLDLPVGTGFSYSKTKAAHQSNTTQACQQAYEFLLKWLIDHPEFVSNSLYVAGDSYAGVFVPIITQIILDENDKGFSSKINIKGYVLGNPYAVPDYDNYKIPFAHGMGLISDELFESWKKNCKGESYANINPENVKCYDDVQAFKQVVGKINEPHILEPLCSGSSFRSQKGFAQSRILLEQSNDFIRTGPFLSIVKCRSDVYVFSENWANDERVREALHVKKGSIGVWKRCSSNLDYIQTTDDITSYHLNLSARGYRSLIYSGDHDFLVTYISTQAWIRSLNYSIIDEWRPWMVEDQVAGFARTYSNKMTFATVKGAGHTAPEYKPKECLRMILRWLSNKSL